MRVLSLNIYKICCCYFLLPVDFKYFCVNRHRIKPPHNYNLSPVSKSTMVFMHTKVYCVQLILYRRQWRWFSKACWGIPVVKSVLIYHILFTQVEFLADLCRGVPLFEWLSLAWLIHLRWVTKNSLLRSYFLTDLPLKVHNKIENCPPPHDPLKFDHFIAWLGGWMGKRIYLISS